MECLEGSLTPEVFVERDSMEVLRGCPEMEDVYRVNLRGMMDVPLISRVFRSDPVKTS